MLEIWAETHVGLHVTCPLILSDINQNLNYRQILVKLSKFKFKEKSILRFTSGFMRRGAEGELEGRGCACKRVLASRCQDTLVWNVLLFCATGRFALSTRHHLPELSVGTAQENPIITHTHWFKQGRPKLESILIDSWFV
jgi:hypothetical protein